MAALEHNLVYQSLSSSPHARLLRGAELSDELAAALWSNHHDARDYQGPSHHTLSCYLAGGTGTFRRERPGAKGAPDKLCVLPAGHESSCDQRRHPPGAPVCQPRALRCQRRRPARPRAARAAAARKHLPRRPAAGRAIPPAGDAGLERAGRAPADQQPVHEMVDHVLLTQVGQRQGLKLKGGSAPHLRRRLVEYIEGTWTSRWHSASWRGWWRCRSTTSRACSVPASACRRTAMCCNAACAGRANCCSTAPFRREIALACGFASASHFSNRFRQTSAPRRGLLRAARQS